MIAALLLIRLLREQADDLAGRSLPAAAEVLDTPWNQEEYFQRYREAAADDAVLTRDGITSRTGQGGSNRLFGAS